MPQLRASTPSLFPSADSQAEKIQTPAEVGQREGLQMGLSIRFLTLVGSVLGLFLPRAKPGLRATWGIRTCLALPGVKINLPLTLCRVDKLCWGESEEIKVVQGTHAKQEIM